MELFLDCVSKQYHKSRALDNVSMRMSEGIYSFLGPNGAGKTTLIKLLSGNIRPTSGEIMLDGMNIDKASKWYKSKIGYMPQQQEFYPFFSGRRFLEYIGGLKGISKMDLCSKVEEMGENVNLSPFLDDRISTYSGGMKQRLLLAQAFLGDPDIVLLDEPTTGLDPLERIRTRNLISRYSMGRIIIVSTHVVQDIELVADMIVFMDKGKIRKRIRSETKNDTKCRAYEIIIPPDKYIEYSKRFVVSRVYRNGMNVRLRVLSEMEVKDGQPVPLEIEDVYMELFGKMNVKK